MVTEDGESLGEATKNTDHLDGHLDEKYYVPSLLVNAIKHYQVSTACGWLIGSKWDFGARNCDQFANIAKEQIESSIKRYLRSQYGLAQ